MNRNLPCEFYSEKHDFIEAEQYTSTNTDTDSTAGNAEPQPFEVCQKCGLIKYAQRIPE